jgi:pimeloyl-ACP methyl ester carboxylesterase
MVSRRSFLLGAGAALLAGGAVGGYELASHPDQRWRILNALGLESEEDFQPPKSGATQTSGTLDSRYTRSAMGWTITTPGSGHPPEAVIFCLHAKGGNHRMAFDDIRVPDMAAHVGLQVAVAAVDGGVDSYWHQRADGTDAMSMFLHEFIPLTQQHIGRIPQAVMGWSMGGYGALLAAERASGRFKGVAPAGPALWLHPGDTAPGAFDSSADFYANDVFTGVNALKDSTVALACGTSDPFYPAASHLASLMTFPHTQIFHSGHHDGAFWRSVAPTQLRTIAPALGLSADT